MPLHLGILTNGRFSIREPHTVEYVEVASVEGRIVEELVLEGRLEEELVLEGQVLQELVLSGEIESATEIDGVWVDD